MEGYTMELDITKLREQRRPLWMSSLEIDNYADMLGGGGDIWQDRLTLDWERHTGVELSDEEARELGFESAEEGYKSVPSESETAEASAASTSSSTSQETSSSESKSSPGIGVGVGADVNVELSGVTDTVDEVTGVVSDTVSKTTKTLGNILGGVTKKVKDATKE
jgi:hypothetical protein